MHKLAIMKGYDGAQTFFFIGGHKHQLFFRGGGGVGGKRKSLWGKCEKIEVFDIFMLKCQI